VEPAAIEPALRFPVIFVLLSTPDMYFYGLEWMWALLFVLIPPLHNDVWQGIREERLGSIITSRQSNKFWNRVCGY